MAWNWTKEVHTSTYSTRRGRKAVYKLLKFLESLTLAWLLDVKESIMLFIWGMEKEFGRLLHGRFQVVKLVFHQVRDKIGENKKGGQLRYEDRTQKIEAFPWTNRGEPRAAYKCLHCVFVDGLWE